MTATIANPAPLDETITIDELTRDPRFQKIFAS